jgi:2-hydroxychromene-2-carboxylate isomerase
MRPAFVEIFMPSLIEFYFDYLSPYTYLANTRLSSLGADIAYRPVFIMDVMQLVNNQPSPKCPAKARYSWLDAARWAKRYDIPLSSNQDLWCALSSGQFDARRLIRGALAAEEMGVFNRYHTAIFNAVWCNPRDLVSESGRDAVLRDAGVSPESIWPRADTPELHARLDEDSRAAAEKGIFGSPTFIVEGEMFFGNDRLDFVAERLASVSAAA